MTVKHVLLQKGARYRLIFKMSPLLGSIHQFRGLTELIKRTPGMTLIDLSNRAASVSLLPNENLSVSVGAPMVVLLDNQAGTEAKAVLVSVVPEVYPVIATKISFPNPPTPV